MKRIDFIKIIGGCLVAPKLLLSNTNGIHKTTPIDVNNKNDKYNKRISGKWDVQYFYPYSSCEIGCAFKCDGFEIIKRKLRSFLTIKKVKGSSSDINGIIKYHRKNKSAGYDKTSDIRLWDKSEKTNYKFYNVFLVRVYGSTMFFELFPECTSSNVGSLYEINILEEIK